ncbi:MAG: hypothetical protein Unbinned273contig1001_53 [Prokaryotic dsDNA virus sp.]|nr:MAG: hypothetical protein Unbinned273contig1001_53 [Prokaryotic dsDNA virus sp.]|tara:strand:+ start:3542 stop:3964 length:423 start_codon:yes stop_codon:yes gene_type:complete
MASAPKINLVAYKRVPFDKTIPDFRGDYSGATVSMQIRAEEGDAGSALVTLGASSSGSEGVAITYDGAYTFEHNGTTHTGASLINIIINETTLEALSPSADTSDPLVLKYDLHITAAGVNGGKKFVAVAGAFTVYPGVTQ